LHVERTAFFDFIDLPHRTDQPLEVALFLAESDESDRRTLEGQGWQVRHSRDVAGSPEEYRAYVQGSRGEFGSAKASCMKFQNAWISDRSLCYLASGKPVVVQHTGPARFFRTARACSASRRRPTPRGHSIRSTPITRTSADSRDALRRSYFDAEAVVTKILEQAL
jgi:hypothetical protein